MIRKALDFPKLAQNSTMMTLANWRAEGDFLSFEGKQIFYQDQGEGGTSILLLHGFPTASWDWHKIWPSLLQHYRLITLDFLGFGYSDKPRRYKYSFMEQVDIIEALLQSRGVNSCHVLAHDYGDTVAQEIIARALNGALSFRIFSVCLLNGGIFPEAHSRRLIQQLLLSPIGFIVGRLATKRTLRTNFQNIFGPNTPPTAAEIDDFWALIVHNGGRYVMHALSQYLREREHYRERWADALQRCPVPLRLINGSHDPISGRQMVVRFQELVDAPDTISFPNIGHYPQTEAPERVLRHYYHFLGQVEIAS